MANGSTGHCDRDVRDGRSQFDWVFTLGMRVLRVIRQTRSAKPYRTVTTPRGEEPADVGANHSWCMTGERLV